VLRRPGLCELLPLRLGPGLRLKEDLRLLLAQHVQHSLDLGD